VLQAALANERAEGELTALAQSVLTVLDARGLAVTDAQRAQALSCRDAATLVQWQRRAVTAANAADALGST